MFKIAFNPAEYGLILNFRDSSRKREGGNSIANLTKLNYREPTTKEKSETKKPATVRQLCTE